MLQISEHKWIYNALLGIIALAPIGFYCCTKKKDRVESVASDVIHYNISKACTMEVGAEFKVVACKVVDGSVFRLLLDNDIWIDARLTSATTEEATEPVSQFLKTANSPSVILRRQVGDSWVVTFNVMIDGRRTSIVEWLSERKLILK